MHRYAISLCLLTLTSGAFGQEASRVEIAKRLKQSTVLVESTDNRTYGSAFCIVDSGIFLTNEHVVGNATTVKLVLHPGLRDQQVLNATVVRTDKDLDLALLKVEDKGPFVPVPLGSSEGLAEQQDLIVAGFPFGKALSLEKDEYPSVSVTSGKITALRMKQGSLERIQMDAVVSPGSSGGPVLNARGRLIGVVVSGIRGANYNFVIPVSHVSYFANTPVIEVTLPPVQYADRFKPLDIAVKASELIPSKVDFEVQVIVGPNAEKGRTLTLIRDKGVYRTKAPLVIQQQGLPVSLMFADGRVEGHVAVDPSFKIGKETVKLSQLQKMRFVPQVTAQTRDQKILTGEVLGLNELEVLVGGATIKVDPRKAVEMIVGSAESDANVPYTVVLRRQGREIASMRNTVHFLGAPGTNAAEDANKLDGLWVLDWAEENGGTWPINNEEAIVIEGNRVRWAKASGKVLPGGREAQIVVDPAKKPMVIDFYLIPQKGPNPSWLGIYKIADGKLTLAINCDSESRPVQFTTKLSAGKERATFVRTYRRAEIKPEDRLNFNPLPERPELPRRVRGRDNGLPEPQGRLGRDNGWNVRLGVQVARPSDQLADQLDLPQGQGLVIEQLTANSAAGKAGVKVNDILLELNGKPVPDSPEQFVRQLADIKANEAVDAVVLRKGRKEMVKGLSLP